MRILRLNLLAFGPFTDESLALDEGHYGLHLVYGDNEAGKSSALRALRQFFYGIPHNSTDNFLHPHKQMRIGAALQADDGSVVEYIRRKARSKTLFQGDDTTPADPAELHRLLGNLDFDSYCHRFGIDHPSLVQGGRAIVQGEGDLGKILFAAASGIANLGSVQKRLTEEADKLFRPNASVLTINKALSELQQARKALREAQLPSSEWQLHDRTLKQAEAEKADVERCWSQAESARRRLERLEQALPLISKRAGLVQELECLGNTPRLSEDFAERRREASNRLAAERQTLQEVAEDLRQLETELASLQVQPELLAHADRIEALYRELGSPEKARQDLPVLLDRRTRLEHEAEAILRDELNRTESLEAARQLRVRSDERKRIQELARALESLKTSRKEALSHLEDLQLRLAQLERQAQQLAAARDVGELRRALRRIQQEGDLQHRLDQLGQRLRKLQQQAAVELRQLPQWAGTLEELELLPVPALESVDRAESELDQLDRALQMEANEQEKLARQQQTCQEQIRQLELANDVPSGQDLVDARERRDWGWQLVRSSLQGQDADEKEVRRFQKQFPLSSSLEAAFERSLQEADEIADRLWRQAERVAQKAALAAELERLAQEAAQRRERIRQLDEQQARALARWQQVWQPCQIEPLTPREMRAWLTQRATLVKRAEELRREELEMNHLAECLERHRGELLECLASAGLAPEATLTLGRLLELGEDYVEQQEQLAQKHEALAAKRSECEQECEKTKRRLAQVEDQLQAWKQQWAEAIRPLQLDPDSRCGQVLQILTSHEQLQSGLQEIENLDQRIRDIRSDLQRYSSEAQRVFQLVTGQTAPDDFSEAVVQLDSRLRVARETEARRNGLQQRQEKRQTRREEAQERAREAAAMLQTLCEEAGCQSPDELPLLEGQAARRRTLERDLKQLDEQLLQLSAGMPLEQFLREAGEVDADQLPTQVRQLTDELEQLKRRKEELLATIAREELELKRMNGAAAAAAADERIQQLLAQVEDESRRYVRLRLASAVLREAIERYREKHQGPVLRRASELFCELTQGSFSGLKADYTDDGRAILVGVRPDGRQTVSVDGMSDGCCDQLYLALRLASVEHYLDHHAPVPVVVDDILIQFDDRRSIAALRTLAALSARTQVIFFTHHEHLVRLAQAHLEDDVLFVHRLDHRRSAAAAGALVLDGEHNA